METQKVDVSPQFEGTKANQTLAARVFGLFQTQGAFFSDYAPIRLPLGQIVEYLAATGDSATAAAVDKALSASPQVFNREESGDEVYFITTKRGTAVAGIAEPDQEANNLKARFTTPEPRREPVRPRRTVETSSTTDSIEDEAQIIEKTYAPDSWQAAVAAALREAQARERGGEPVEDAVTGFDIQEMVDLSDVVIDFESAEPTMEQLEQIIEEEEISLDDIETETIDISGASDDDLAEAIQNSLEPEPDIARWGDLWMHESKVAKLSRGDLRRALEYIEEAGEPMGDVELVQDLRSVNPGSPDFPLERFTVNFRLSRETRDFEYLGSSTEGLWAITGMQHPGTEKRKASELGQDYRFLLDYKAAPEDLEEGIIEHVLTFYEFQYGVLPLNAAFRSIMPKPAFGDQRAARLTFESPQTEETFEAELRFATSNRGGYLVGFERFFEDNLVPGAVLTIEATDSPRHFIIEYFQMSQQDRRLLHLDSRKNKYVFKPTSFFCGLQEDMLVDENRFPRLADAEPLDERVRRRPELVIARTFERVGENVGTADDPRWSASLIDLLAAANIERPISVEYLRDILTGGAYPEFSVNDAEEDAFFYHPAASN